MTTGVNTTPAERPERIEILQSFDCGAKVITKNGITIISTIYLGFLNKREREAPFSRYAPRM